MNNSKSVNQKKRIAEMHTHTQTRPNFGKHFIIGLNNNYMYGKAHPKITLLQRKLNKMK